MKISGVVEFPDGMKRGERRAAILVLHGFGSNKDSPMVRTVTRMFTSLGYVALRFDMRGCGESEGERGRVICLEQVADTKSAFDFLCTTDYADPKRIAV
ncbi:MAG TPA: alpha/beta hydrolase, partial [Burkholderiales bacterium]|nr:alpha/beta hydrolase [Burkholderiales bacterium]